MEKLRKLVTHEIRKSISIRNYGSKDSCPKWWDRKLDFHNVKSGYSKETLVGLLRRYRAYDDDSSITTPLASSIRDRSPYTSSPSLSNTPIHGIQNISAISKVMPLSYSTSLILPPPHGFSDPSLSPEISTNSTPRSVFSESGIHQDSANSYDQQVELYSDGSSLYNWDESMGSSVEVAADKYSAVQSDDIEPYFPTLPQNAFQRKMLKYLNALIAHLQSDIYNSCT